MSDYYMATGHWDESNEDGSNPSQLEVLQQRLFGDTVARMMAMSQTQHDAIQDKLRVAAKDGFKNCTRFELRYQMWHCLSFMVGYDYQPAETAHEHEMEAETEREFWAALRAYLDTKDSP